MSSCQQSAWSLKLPEMTMCCVMSVTSFKTYCLEVWKDKHYIIFQNLLALKIADELLIPSRPFGYDLVYFLFSSLWQSTCSPLKSCLSLDFLRTGCMQGLPRSPHVLHPNIGKHNLQPIIESETLNMKWHAALGGFRSWLLLILTSTC